MPKVERLKPVLLWRLCHLSRRQKLQATQSRRCPQHPRVKDGRWQVLGSLFLKQSVVDAKKSGMLSLTIRCSFSFHLTMLRISPYSQEPTLLNKPVNADQAKMSSLYLPYADYLKFWKLLERLSLYKCIAFWFFHNKILYCSSAIALVNSLLGNKSTLVKVQN